MVRRTKETDMERIRKKYVRRKGGRYDRRKEIIKEIIPC
jgi:hypothetical protein